MEIETHKMDLTQIKFHFYSILYPVETKEVKIACLTG